MNSDSGLNDRENPFAEQQPRGQGQGQVEGQGQGQQPLDREAASAVRKRRLREGRNARRGAATDPDAAPKLPRCEPFPLTVGTEAPLPRHQRRHPYPQIVIAHRGASAHLPEHSLEAYRLALELGADYIEPDLVSSKDGYLVAMHSLDLTQTTDVLEVFGASRNKTLSRYKKEQQKEATADDSDFYGYWVYDFTLEELKQLRLKQRLGGSNEERSTAFDGLFEIPTLTEILELLNDWNENVQHLWYASGAGVEVDGLQPQQESFPPPPRGLYAELKDYPWILQDANIDLLDLLFEHMNDEQFAWETALLRHMCDTKHLRWGEYKLPPLILQSFEAEVLKKFTIRWEQLARSNQESETSESESDTTISSSLFAREVPIDGNNTALIPLPTPPTIVLVSHDRCRDESFWYEMRETYRNHISGIGPHKMCFFREQPQSAVSTPAAQDASPPLFKYEPTVMEQAKKLNWVVHPWTARPEYEFFATTPKERNGRRASSVVTPFESVLEEILFLKCTVGVDGLFSESVNIAVRALTLPCPASNEKNSDGSNADAGTDGGGTTTGTEPCPSGKKSGAFSMNAASVPLGPVVFFSFFLGILVALVVLKKCFGMSLTNRPGQPTQRRSSRQSGRRQRHSHSAVPATDDGATNDTSEAELNDSDHEML